MYDLSAFNIVHILDAIYCMQIYYLQIHGAFFNCSHPKNSKCQSVSKFWHFFDWIYYENWHLEIFEWEQLKRHPVYWCNIFKHVCWCNICSVCNILLCAKWNKKCVWQKSCQIFSATTKYIVSSHLHDRIPNTIYQIHSFTPFIWSAYSNVVCPPMSSWRIDQEKRGTENRFSFEKSLNVFEFKLF